MRLPHYRRAQQKISYDQPETANGSRSVDLSRCCWSADISLLGAGTHPRTVQAKRSGAGAQARDHSQQYARAEAPTFSQRYPSIETRCHAKLE